MADFLILVLIYILFFAVTVYIFLFGESEYHRNGIVGKTRCFIVKIGTSICMYFLPSVIRESAWNAVVHVLYKKNCYLQMFYLFLLVGISYIYTVSINPHIKQHQLPSEDNTAIIGIIATNFILFLSTGFCDPGVITKDNLSVYQGMYEFDGKMYQEGTVCRTCHFDKPARSKHCAFCDRCVYRFDHHCSWVNNCIGGGNVHLFILLLVSITLGSLYGSIVIAKVFLVVVRSKRIMEASYMGSDRMLHPVTKMIVFQHMFMEYPGMVFLMTSLCLLSILVGVFTVYHIYLAVTNQTTNERYKRSEMILHSEHTGTGQSSNRMKYNYKNSIDVHRTASERTRSYFYSKGIVLNLCEVFLPSKGR